ncbi:RibD family protein [Aspergillus tanneri]|uniref:2,5-diamino-6-ribosylamino-4(3H)-pyrimidinone 5'-phosphate reductase n=1 Tax=Aspergillus tanneri TaxID=1220188 RepID=A0A5M9MY81_9EURO|nr:2,5-diamino-6-(ribosylamino)-4(3H)-pyrimidinone 5'-phosphate reductase [Aspergillus tanneri]KAA8650324.1 2,5-diamino-6-(ribosylamino)-4(3H)-pyrimidinone 5'-phosphate reductase [Aspergillus tanneri]
MAAQKASNAPRDALSFPGSDRIFLDPHLPFHDEDSTKPHLPFTTLTFATSLDSSLALSPGVRTVLSGPQSKAMTHYLRSRHDAILIGVGTAVADNPGLNCRIAGVGGYGGEGLTGQPRPIVIDPTARWDFTEESKILVLAREGQGRAPYIITCVDSPPSAKRALLERHGGKYITLDVLTTDDGSHRIDWTVILQCLKNEGLSSVMVEGGGSIINSLLEPTSQQLIDSVIVTIAPTWLGQGGVVVSPKRRVDDEGAAIPASRLTGVKWYPFGEDVVLCGKIKT